MRFLRRFEGTAIIAANIHQRRVPYMTREQIAKRRDKRVRQTVRHAAKHVPYYRELFAREGIDAREIQTVEQLRQLPVLDRKAVRETPEQFVSDNARHTLLQRTSGTTGTPMEVWHDRRSIIANVAFGEREREAVIKLVGEGFRPRELYVGFTGSNFTKVVNFIARETWLPIKPRRHSILVTEPFEAIIEAINRYKPHILTAYGTFADELFRRVRAEGIDIAMPKILMYIGETLAYDRRQQLESDFNLKVMSRYVAVESFKIAYYCEARKGFHVHEDLCDVQIRRADGSVADPGETGEIVISNLVNRATVLLNYPMGDLAAFHTKECTCGRNFRLLSHIDGRLEDLMPLPGGRVLHPRAIWGAFKHNREVLQYQLEQTGLSQFTLRLVTRNQDAFAQASAMAEKSLLELFGTGIALDIVSVPELGREQRTKTGKFRAVISRVGGSASDTHTEDN